MLKEKKPKYMHYITYTAMLSTAHVIQGSMEKLNTQNEMQNMVH